MITVGMKLNHIADKYFENNKKRLLVKDLINLVNTLNSKKKKSNIIQRKIKEKIKKRSTKQVDKDLNILKNQNVKKKPNKNKITYATHSFTVGDIVRIQESISLGTIEKIEKKKATVNYGNFTTKVDLSKLELAK